MLKKNQESCHVFVSPSQPKPIYVHKCIEGEDSLSKRKDTIQERKAQRALEQYGKHKGDTSTLFLLNMYLLLIYIGVIV